MTYVDKHIPCSSTASTSLASIDSGFVNTLADLRRRSLPTLYSYTTAPLPR